MLVERGFSVRIEHDAASTIHYTDNQYTRAGAEVTTRQEALQADIVIHLAPLAPADIRHIRRGAMLFSLLDIERQSPDTIRE